MESLFYVTLVLIASFILLKLIMRNNAQKKSLGIRIFASFASFKNNSNSEELHAIADNAVVYERKDNMAFANHIEMAGFSCAAIISYGHKMQGELELFRHAVFPSLRKYPNDTHSSFDRNFNGISLKADGKKLCETFDKAMFDGVLRIRSHAGEIEIERSLFPARNAACLIEIIECTNKSQTQKRIMIANNDSEKLFPRRFAQDRKKIIYGCEINDPFLELKPGEAERTHAVYYACIKSEKVVCNYLFELEERKRFIALLDEKLVITTPEPVVNSMLRFSKIRASESIFKTKRGLMHSPGGGGYYAALWTNDQCEYVNPLFGYLGYDIGKEQAVNCYSLYEQYIFADKALITSIIAEGDGVWHGARDRGDSAMYAYGLSRFLLSNGDKTLAGLFLDSLRKCIEFTLSQKNENGVIASDSDELENRFECGKANLSTSCLAYDALISCSYIEKELGNDEFYKKYQTEAAELCEKIEKYFGCEVEGFETYRYCAEETKLRSWICLPLAVGIFERREETAKALLSDKLCMKNGLVTRSGETTFWDRSTLYALRGLFYSGEGEKAYELLLEYTYARHKGMHVPYAVEACPEGNQAQLSAESGLYVRIFTEGILGYRPTSFSSFTLIPNLPKEWDFISVKNFSAHGEVFDLEIKKADEASYEITLSNGFKTSVDKGTVVEIDLKTNIASKTEATIF